MWFLSSLIKWNKESAVILLAIISENYNLSNFNLSK